SLGPAGPPVAAKTPLWPVILSVFYRLFGQTSVRPEQVFLCIIGALTCVLIIALARDVFPGRQDLAIGAGIIAAIDPYAIEWSGYLLSEAMYVFLTIALLLALSRATQKENAISVFVAAAALGLGMLAHPTALIYNGVLITWRLYCRCISWRRLTVVIVGGFVILSPWIVRNALTFHELIPATTQGGSMLIGNYHPGALADPNSRGTWQPIGLREFLRMTGGDLSQSSSLGEVAYDHVATQAALHWIVANPVTSAQLAIWKMLYLWVRWPSGGLAKWLGYVIYLAFLASSAIGVGRARPLTPVARLILWCVLWSTGLAVISGGEGRYRAQLEPLIALFAAAGLETILSLAHLRLNSTGHFRTARG
ncbi:MAG TPA: glycosyltransferase family 39 protein, partial [Chloroflexota bacterium]|nr:glycosyltransferase family 39 protein [Chloroflexota bacterium]